MKLEPLMNYNGNLVGFIDVDKGSFGNRVIVEVDGGECAIPSLVSEASFTSEEDL